MTRKPKEVCERGREDAEPPCPDAPQKGEYYYDDAHGYVDFDPESEDENDAESES